MSDEQPNGTAPRIQRREVWVELNEAYAGFKVKLWVNAPQKLWQEMDSGDEARIRAAIMAVVLEHNGWLDFDGQPYPPAREAAFWNDIPDELAAVIIVTCKLEASSLGKSLVPTTKRR